MPNPERRKALVEIAELAEDYLLTRASAVISPRVDEAALKGRIDELLAAGARPLAEVAADLFAMLGEGIVRTDSPRYFGLYLASCTLTALLLPLGGVSWTELEDARRFARSAVPDWAIDVHRHSVITWDAHIRVAADDRTTPRTHRA